MPFDSMKLPPEIWLIILRHLRKLNYLEKQRHLLNKIYRPLYRSLQFWNYPIPQARAGFYGGLAYSVVNLNKYLHIKIFPRFIIYCCYYKDNRNMYHLLEITYGINLL